MKKIMNDSQTLVPEMCKGICFANPSLEYISKYKVIKKKEINPQKVTLISGGGSGHEPAHAGFIGKGMLDSAVCGDVFASPSQIQVYQGIKASLSEKGTLLIIKNYSGDMMNFKNAAEMAKDEGINVDYVRVEDDIAVNDSLYTVGRRGVAGTVLVHKVAGAAAESGLDLAEVKRVAQKTADNVRTIGFAMTSCTVPAAKIPTFDIGENEIEYGVGIHGEPGRSREQMQTADELSERMINQLVDDLKVQKGEKVTLLINGFGGTPLQELYALNHSAYKMLAKMGIKIHRSFAGNYMTSLEMQGASISILKMDNELDRYIDYPCETMGFVVNGPVESLEFSEENEEKKSERKQKITFPEEWAEISGNKITLENLTAMIGVATEFILIKEVEFCKLDSYAGDGDFGMSIAKGFTILKNEWNDLITNHYTSIKDFLHACSIIIMEHCGGASGPIWGSAFRSMALKAGDVRQLSLSEFAEMLQEAVRGVQVTGERSFGRGAVVGDKTLIDALAPAADSLSKSASNGESMQIALSSCANSAVIGAENTKSIVARMGRAGTVGERSLGYPDAGAFAIGEIFTEIYSHLKFN